MRRLRNKESVPYPVELRDHPRERAEYQQAYFNRFNAELGGNVETASIPSILDLVDLARKDADAGVWRDLEHPPDASTSKKRERLQIYTRTFHLRSRTMSTAR